MGVGIAVFGVPCNKPLGKDDPVNSAGARGKLGPGPRGGRGTGGRAGSPEPRGAPQVRRAARPPGGRGSRSRRHPRVDSAPSAGQLTADSKGSCMLSWLPGKLGLPGGSSCAFFIAVSTVICKGLRWDPTL